MNEDLDYKDHAAARSRALEVRASDALRSGRLPYPMKRQLKSELRRMPDGFDMPRAFLTWMQAGEAAFLRLLEAAERRAAR